MWLETSEEGRLARDGLVDSEAVGNVFRRTRLIGTVAPGDLPQEGALVVAQGDDVADVREVEPPPEGGPLNVSASEGAGGNTASEDDQALAGTEAAAQREAMPLGVVGIRESPPVETQLCGACIHQLHELVVDRATHAVPSGVAIEPEGGVGVDLVDDEGSGTAGRCRHTRRLGVLPKEVPPLLSL